MFMLKCGAPSGIPPHCYSTLTKKETYSCLYHHQLFLSTLFNYSERYLNASHPFFFRIIRVRSNIMKLPDPFCLNPHCTASAFLHLDGSPFFNLLPSCQAEQRSAERRRRSPKPHPHLAFTHIPADLSARWQLSARFGAPRIPLPVHWQRLHLRRLSWSLTSSVTNRQKKMALFYGWGSWTCLLLFYPNACK